MNKDSRDLNRVIWGGIFITIILSVVLLILHPKPASAETFPIPNSYKASEIKCYPRYKETMDEEVKHLQAYIDKYEQVSIKSIERFGERALFVVYNSERDIYTLTNMSKTKVCVQPFSAKKAGE